MTAEIVVMNKMGVALAADSAISITTSRGVKIYHGNKLFMLSKYEPVGLMIYGSAELMNVPWESIVKVYRNDLKKMSFRTLEEYGDHFISFLNNNNFLFPQARQEDYCYGLPFSFFATMKEAIDESVEKIIHKGLRISTSEIKRITKRVIDEAVAFVNDLTRLDTMPPGFERNVLSHYYNIIDQAIDDVFQKLPLTVQLRKQLRRIAVGLFARDTSDFLDASGIVIAGFGADDLYPAVVSYEMDGVILDTLKYRKHLEGGARIETNNSAVLIPYAQKEMVISFMEGSAPKYREALDTYLETIFDEYPKHIIKKIPRLSDKQKRELRQQMIEAGKTLSSEFWENVTGWAATYNVLPILNTIEVLPLDELASMAESLVNLTSFKRRVTLVPETVGGPIDVAVISKGDGFIWIKRTRYFDPDKNPHFFRNYYSKEV